MDRHWVPRPRAVGVALDSYDKPYIIKFAPGGRYVVAATRSIRDGEFGVVIWDLETPNTPTALVRYQTRTLLSFLLVKWMVWEEQQGLAVVMLRLLDGSRAIKKTEVHVVHISLDNLHRLSADVMLDALPFKEVQTLKNHCQIAQVSLEDHILLLTHRPRTLMFLNLLTRETCQIKLRNAIPEYVGVPVFMLNNLIILITAHKSDIRFGEDAYSRIRIKYWLSDSSIVTRTMLQPLKYLIFLHGASLSKTLPLSNNKSSKALLRVP